MLPAMSEAEIACYSELLNQASSLIEFGAGGSTLLATARNVRTVSIESDLTWIEKLRCVPAAVDSERNGLLSLIHADIGEVGPWGHPIDAAVRHKWPSYSMAPWLLCQRPGLVLIDGRFRVACIAQATLHCGRNSVIAVHDFWPRPVYHVALQLLDWVSSVDTLAVFRPRAWSGRKARSLFEGYKYDPA